MVTASDPRKEQNSHVLGVAELIFGDKVIFINYPTSCSLEEFFRLSILGVASALHPSSFSAISPSDIDLEEYQEFHFYAEDPSGRKVPLRGKEKQFQAILQFFSRKLTVHIILAGK